MHSVTSSYAQPKPVGQNPIRFGSSGGAGSIPGIGGRLSFLEAHPLVELTFKDVLGSNAPKITLTRSWKERLDTATLELSNTGITLFSSLLLPRLLRYPVSKLSGVPVSNLSREIPYALQNQTSNAIKLARLGTSFSFFFPFAAAFWAAPFFRNWLTLKRTNSANFEEIIGLNGVEQNKRSPEEEKAFQKKRAWQIFGGGLALGAASLLGFSAAARGVSAKEGQALWKNLSTKLDIHWRKQWTWLFDKFELKGRGAYQIAGGPATLIFWGLPAYMGWVHAARSNNERRERLLQSANALFWFFFAPVLTGWLWHKPFLAQAGKPELWKKEFLNAIRENMEPGGDFSTKFKNRIANLKYNDIHNYFNGTAEQKQQLIRLKNWKFAISGLAIPISSLALVQLLNFRITERKIKSATQTRQNTPTGNSPIMFQRTNNTVGAATQPHFPFQVFNAQNPWSTLSMPNPSTPQVNA